MNLNCAILHADGEVVRKLEEYIGKVPFLSLCGTYDNPLEALKDYYEMKVEIYFIGICASEEGGVGGMDFSRMLSLPTRVIFVADTDLYAAECFRLDALDYLAGDFDFSVFLQAVSKATRWFAFQLAPVMEKEKKTDVDLPQALYVRTDSRIMKLMFKEIRYIEALGDYVKIYTQTDARSIMILCSMKCMEERLPEEEFIRVHRSFIVCKNCIDTISANNVVVDGKEIPIGNAYREQVKRYVARLSVL